MLEYWTPSFKAIPFRKSHFLINRLSGFIRTCDQGLGSFQSTCVTQRVVGAKAPSGIRSAFKNRTWLGVKAIEAGAVLT